MDVNEELNFLWNSKNNFFLFFFLGGGGVRGGGGGRVGWDQGGCERRFELKFL